MGFEKVVLNQVAEVLQNDNSASFCSGTLFVNCSAREAARIETALSEVTHGGIVVSPIGQTGEFAFDFV